MTDAAEGVGIDLEIGGRGQLVAVGAVRGDQSFHQAIRSAPHDALRALDEFARGAPFVFGHNILRHDRPELRKLEPRLALLTMPAVDTLILSTIAFAEHPYHALVKDYKLVRTAMNDPVADAANARRLLGDVRQRLAQLAATEPAFVRWLRGFAPNALREFGAPAAAGVELVLGAPVGADEATPFVAWVGDRVCRAGLARVLTEVERTADLRTPLLLTAGWLRVAGTAQALSPSVLPPWVRSAFPAVRGLVATLRSTPCAAPDCTWCRSVHDPREQLRRWFGFDDFRAEPRLADGRGAQAAIVAAGFGDRPLLALLPTGGGKSLCFQLPALARHLRSGSLTVVISPLQSLMHDQVENFAAKTGADAACALSGRLSLPERRAALDAIRSGRTGIVYVSPEQLRNRSFAKAIALREIGAWVFDEAHCLSKWGHDFRPDYLYAARFIRESASRQGIPAAPIVCVTATARPEVRDEILAHFRDELGQHLDVFDGHAERTNLTLAIERILPNARSTRIVELVAEELATSPTGSVLVYTATRNGAEATAKVLTLHGIDAAAFHAGLDVSTKKTVQTRFLRGEVRVVAATNAFGMGIDKPDIRRVVHAEIPGSLEAYVQEVGRAGRDGAPANAVLLFADDDIEGQFRMAAAGKLGLRDVQTVLRRVRSLGHRVGADEVRETVCTTGEILQDLEVAAALHADERGAPNKVVTAIAWLERGRFVSRDENATTVFQGRPLVATLEEAHRRIEALALPPRQVVAWLTILERLVNGPPDAGLSTDDLLELPTDAEPQRLALRGGGAVLRTLLEMRKAGLLSAGTAMTAFVRHGLADPSTARAAAAARLETSILDKLRELEPDPELKRAYPLHLCSLTQALAADDPAVTLDQVRRVLGALGERPELSGAASAAIQVRMTARDRCTVIVGATWDTIVATVRRRQVVAAVCLQTMLTDVAASDRRGAAVLAEFTLEQVQDACERDLELRSTRSPDMVAEIEYALLFLHRVGAIHLHRGLAVFRPAMTLRLPPESAKRRFGADDFAPLAQHQEQRTSQIHVVQEFAERMIRSPDDGRRLLDDYFRLPSEQFLTTHFRARRGELSRPTSARSWQRIVKNLSPDQRRIVEAAEDGSVLVLAGPGSGKTRVIVHRCAYLLRVKRVPSAAIVVLCFNRSAAFEIRHRLVELVGDDARDVLVQTYHGMAARLVGRAPAEALDTAGVERVAFDELIDAATAQLESGAHGDLDDADGGVLRDRLLAGVRHILVDEYQDIDERQYRLVSAIAGRTLTDEDRKLTVLAVGDDDQNIYQWRGSNVAFLRRFEADYGARRVPLAENYRSTAHIVRAAAIVIAQNADRLKSTTPIRVDAARSDDDPGGPFASLDPLARGRVHVLEVAAVEHQALAVFEELTRLAALDPQFAWEQCAVLGREHRRLDAVRTLLERRGIPVRVRISGDSMFSLFRLREVQELVAAIATLRAATIDAATLDELVTELRRRRPTEPNLGLVEQLVAGFTAEYGSGPVERPRFREFVAEQLGEQRRERVFGSGVFLGTIHGAKGTEFDHVAMLDGGFARGGGDDVEASRRLDYVGMTRARRTLTIVQAADGDAPWRRALDGDAVLRTPVTDRATAAELAMLALRYHRLGLGDVWLDYAGHPAVHARAAAAIDRLATGDPLTLVAGGARLFLADPRGVRVGALSKAAAARWLAEQPRIQQVRVAAIVVRRRDDGATDPGDPSRAPAWHVVLPEFCVTPSPS